MLHRWLGILVLSAICLGAGAAGTPVAGDVSVAAVTAGINLSTSAGAHLAPRLAARPRDLSQSLGAAPALLSVFLRLLLAGAATLTMVELGRVRQVMRGVDRALRGPPALV
jgi:hypothetical protein